MSVRSILTACLWFSISIVPLAASASSRICPQAQIDVATTPVPEQYPPGLERAEAVAKQRVDRPDIILIGDSIVEKWGPFENRDFPGKHIWNMGVFGDHTQNVLWRLNDPMLRNVQTKNVILMVGTNNLSLGYIDRCGISAGENAIIARLRELWPEAVLFILPILPRGSGLAYRASDRELINAEMLAKFSQQPKIVPVKVDQETLACGPIFCDSYESDSLHLASSGYAVLRKALENASISRFGVDILK